MKRRVTDSGIRNNFGYVDAVAKEIVLRHPCSKKNDIEDMYQWLEEATDLRKLSIGIGAMDNIILNDHGDGLLDAVRNLIHGKVSQSQALDSEMLKNVLNLVKDKKELRSLSLKYFTFSNDKPLFDLFIKVLRGLKQLVFLDLTGCYFTDEQLIDLASVVAQSHIAHLGWPDPRMSDLLTKAIAQKFAENCSIVVMHGVPLDLLNIAQDNRNWLFSYARRPSVIGTKEVDTIREFGESIKLAIAYEKQRLYELEKTVEAVLV